MVGLIITIFIIKIGILSWINMYNQIKKLK